MPKIKTNHDAKQQKEFLFLSFMIVTAFLVSHGGVFPEQSLWIFSIAIIGLLARMNHLIKRTLDT